MQQLRFAAKTSRAYTRALGQLLDAQSHTRDQHVGGWRTQRHSAERESFHPSGWQVLEAVHRKIDFVCQQRTLDLFGKDALGRPLLRFSDLADRPDLLRVAGGLDLDDLNRLADFCEPRRDPPGS